MTAKKLTAEELAVKMEIGNYDWADEAADMLRQQQAEIEALKDFAIWMTGCGYDFRQHIYYNECFDKLLMKEKEHE